MMIDEPPWEEPDPLSYDPVRDQRMSFGQMAAEILLVLTGIGLVAWAAAWLVMAVMWAGPHSDGRTIKIGDAICVAGRC